MTNGNRRRLSVILLGLCLLLIAAIGAQMWHSLSTSSIVEYGGNRIVEPANGELCPGESLVYSQTIHVNTTGMVDISRDWCNRGGTCSLDIHQHWDSVVLTPLDFTGTVTRTVPVSPLFKPGGLYEFRSGVKNGALSVQIVPFEIRTDCEP